MAIKDVWDKFGKYVLIGIGALAFIAGIVYVGQWYASGKADEFANRIHERWMATDGRAIYDNIAINRDRIKELDTNYRDQSDRLDKMNRDKMKGIGNAIKTGDKKVLASMFDNSVDRYQPPASFDK